MKTTLVIPAYDEAGRLEPAAFEQAVAGDPDLNLLFVDDGSRDDTGSVLGGIADRWPGRVAVRIEPVNVGKAEAVRRGMLEALGRDAAIVGYWDADLATPLGELKALREALAADPAIQAVLGSRVRLLGRHIERRAARHYLGRAFATVVSVALRAPVYDTQCGAKLFRAGPILRDALALPFRSRWIFDVELLGRLGKRVPGGLIGAVREVPLTTWADRPGSRLRWHAFVRAPLEMARIYWRELR